MESHMYLLKCKWSNSLLACVGLKLGQPLLLNIMTKFWIRGGEELDSRELYALMQELTWLVEELHMLGPGNTKHVAKLTRMYINKLDQGVIPVRLER